MTRRLLASYLTLTLLVLLALEIPLGITYARAERLRAVEGLERDTTLIAALATGELADPFGGEGLAEAYSRRTGARVFVIAPDGRLIGDTRPEAGTAADLLTLPEVGAALRGRPDSGVRTTAVSRQRVLVAASPVLSRDRVVAAVGAVAPSAPTDQRIRRIWLVLLLVGIGVLAVAGLVGLRLAQLVGGPVASLRHVAGQLAAGDLGARASTDAGPEELQDLGAAFNDMAERLAELIDSQRAFVADASHQLRTPLTALRLRLENLETLVPGEHLDELEACIAETERLSRLVDGLLALARAEGGRAEPVPIDARAVVEARAGLWAPLAQEQGVRMRVDAEDVPAVLVVAGGLEQIVDNLLDNALRAAPSGTSVRLVLREEHPWVALHVLDEGPGLPPHELERAFDRFRSGQGDAGRGSGLGLAIVRQLVRASGGQIELLPNDPSGVDARVRLRFTKTLPSPGRG